MVAMVDFESALSVIQELKKVSLRLLVVHVNLLRWVACILPILHQGLIE